MHICGSVTVIFTFLSPADFSLPVWHRAVLCVSDGYAGIFQGVHRMECDAQCNRGKPDFQGDGKP